MVTLQMDAFKHIKIFHKILSTKRFLGLDAYFKLFFHVMREIKP